MMKKAERKIKIIIKYIIYTQITYCDIIIMKGGENMTKTMYVRASEVAEMLDVSKAKAYKLIAEMNNELRSQNIIVINGRVPRKYLMKRIGE